MDGFLAFVVLAAVALGFAAALGRRIDAWVPGWLLLIAVALRVVGATARFEVNHRIYGGSGDAFRYFTNGQALLEDASLRAVSIFSLEFWTDGPKVWGTPFVDRVSAVVLDFIGPTVRGEFLVFSLLGFVGLYFLAFAFARAQDGARSFEFAAWSWCWPTLWFWPSSVGKEALLLLAIGLTTFGFVGKNGRTNWFVMVAGIGLALLIRPHVAGALAFSAALARWVNGDARLSPRALGELMLMTILAGFTLSGALQQFGVEMDVEDVQHFMADWSQRSTQGASAITLDDEAGRVPYAFVNVWFRPFIWEAHNALAFAAALEVIGFWALVWKRRRAFGFALRHWHAHRLLCFAVPLLVVYVGMLGFVIGNLGIIARQRSLIFPFMFMVVLAVPDESLDAEPDDEPVVG